MQKTKLAPKQADMVAQVAATMAIEDMPLTKCACRNAAAVITGEKTGDQVAAEITERYKNGR